MSPPAENLKAVTLTGSHNSSPVLWLDEGGFAVSDMDSVWLAFRGPTPIEEDGAVLDGLCETFRLRIRAVVLARVGIFHAGPGTTVTLEQTERSPRGGGSCA